MGVLPAPLWPGQQEEQSTARPGMAGAGIYWQRPVTLATAKKIKVWPLEAEVSRVHDVTGCRGRVDLENFDLHLDPGGMV